VIVFICWENNKLSTINICLTYSRANILGFKKIGRLKCSCSKSYTLMMVRSSDKYISHAFTFTYLLNYRVCLDIFDQFLNVPHFLNEFWKWGVSLIYAVFLYIFSQPFMWVYMDLMYLFTYSMKPLFFSFLLIY
jgi:hypothetical protein